VLSISLGAAAAQATEPVDPAAETYRKGLALQKSRKWIAARRAFRRLIKKWPDSEYVEQAAVRCGDNAYLGTVRLWTGGPPERRIDVAVMGDGFTIAGSDQAKEEKWAELCTEVLFHEKAYSEYRNYFNFYYVRLASLEEGVDPQLSPEERAKIEKRNRQRRRKKKIDFNTALDAKAAGPQGQVAMNRSLVYKWLEIANKDVPGCGDDRYVIAFAKFGRLGMGGGGIANVGRPDKSITTHEFGHAFVRLLDEYTGNPNPPPPGFARQLRAANASMTPDPDKVPWAHMLKAHVKGVGIYEGGATFNKGVWRPARTCAMNAAGATAYCPVCREAAILVIYEYVDPIDATEPARGGEVAAVQGDKTMILVTPMQPRRHSLKARWFVALLAPTTQGGDGDDYEPDPEPESAPPRQMFAFGGPRARMNRSEYDQPPKGKPSKLGKRIAGKPRRFAFFAGKLAPGRYTVTVEVRDPTPWVIQDKRHLLMQRASWTVTVAPKKK